MLGNGIFRGISKWSRGAPPRDIEALSRFQRRQLLYVPNGRALYTFIPKNACSTMKVSIFAQKGRTEFLDNIDGLHKSAHDLCATDAEIQNAIFTFVILRDPFQRLASCYLDKFLKKNNAFVLDRTTISKSIDIQDLTFRKFVSWLSRENNIRGNIHWMPQTNFLAFDTYDCYVQQENLVRSMQKIKRRTRLELIDSRKNSRHTTFGKDQLDGQQYADSPVPDLFAMKRRGAVPSVASLYDPDIAAQVRELYAEDIKLYERHFGRIPSRDH